MYSQKAEESYILRLVSDLPSGRFLDIGAYDGYHYSNTMALVERGWSGIMVEPGLHAFQELLVRHGGNERLTLIHAAVDIEPKITQFWNNHATFSTTLPSNRDRFIHEGFAPSFWIPTITFGAILDKFPGPVDVLSIDTEGTSVDLLAPGLALCGPRVVCVEHDGRTDVCHVIAKTYGYNFVVGNEENLIFARV